MAQSNNDNARSKGELSIDARGLKCPLPVLKLEKHLDTAHNPLPVTLYADDPVARIDIPLLCNTRGLACNVREQGTALCFDISANT